MSVDRDKALSSSTTSTFVTSLVVNVALLAAEVGVFLILRNKLWRIYSPRTVLPPPEKRAPAFPQGPLKWLPALVMYKSEDIIRKNGLDAYMFLRYIKLLMWIFLTFTLLTFAVIIPADAAGILSKNDGVERISWTNIINPRDQSRFAAHIVVVYVLTFFVLWLIRREMQNFIHLRHQFLISSSHSKLAQARTVLVTSVPDELANEHDLRTFASFVPGGVDRVWLFRDTRSLNELFERRQEACEQLEAAMAAVLKTAVLAWRKRIKMHRKISKRRPKDEENHESSELPIPPITREFLNDLVPIAKRPHHRVKLLGLMGEKVDTIDWCKQEIAQLNRDLKEGREHIVKGKFLGSAFIRCNLQIGAHVLAQCVSYHEPLMMHSKWMEANPKDIVWANLDDGALEMRGRAITSWAATIGLIIVWAFPVTFIGTLSNLDDLCIKLRWLQWLCDAPTPVPGLVQGVLPPALLAGLFALLPFILKGLAWYECIPRYSLMSVSVYKRFYFFLLIHGFLIVTLSSGITKALEDIIENPTQTVQKLASELPGASVFFLTYMVTQGLAGAGAALAQLAALVFHYIRKWFLGRTPRQAYSVTFLMPSADFGVVLPRLSLLATIGFAYSVLSPLINILAFISYAMYYLAWKFLLSQVFDQPDEKETGGLYFPMAINNLFVGLYIEQICLACLFFLKASGSSGGAIAQAVLMIVLLAITAIAHYFINHSFNPMIQYLPMSLATKEMSKRYEKQRKQKQKEGESENEDDIVDLFSRTVALRGMRRRIRKAKNKLDGKLDNIRSKVVPVDSDTEEKDRESEHDAAAKCSEETLAAEALGMKGTGELHRMKSFESHASRVSKAASKKSAKGILDKVPSCEPATAALTDGDSEDEEDDDDIHAFDHPSFYVDQPWIWIPKDQLGLSGLLVKELQDAGVSASDVGAEMQENAVVEVSRNPPDEDWAGGHDA